MNVLKLLILSLHYKMHRIYLLLIILLLICHCRARTRHHLHHKHDIIRPNIVLFLTDDQDIQLGGMTPMVKANKLIGNHGLKFTNAFASTPICCPSRSSILTGRYQHNHGVYNNSFAGNCNGLSWQEGPEKETLAVHLKQANYTTTYIGKYLNQYGTERAGGIKHIPPGWDHWIALVGNSKYYNYTLSVNGRPEHHGDNPDEDYLTDVITKKAAKVLLDHDSNSGPIFLMLAPPASHVPFTPHPKYHDYFAELKAPRTVSFNISSGPDKHWLLRQVPQHLDEHVVNYVDEVFRSRWRTLLSVDDMVEKVIETLQEKNMLDNTYVFFMSDHGYHLGQFSLPMDKRQAYEFDIRIPLMVRGPGIEPGTQRKEPVVTIDVAPTLMQLAGLTHPLSSMDGKSFVPLFGPLNDHVDWRSSFLVEYKGEGSFTSIPECPQYKHSGLANCVPACICEDAKNNTYVCVRTLNKKIDTVYCEFEDSEKFIEVYDLSNDPGQLRNLAYNVNPSSTMDLNKHHLHHTLIRMLSCSGASCFET